MIEQTIKLWLIGVNITLKDGRKINLTVKRASSDPEQARLTAFFITKQKYIYDFADGYAVLLGEAT